MNPDEVILVDFDQAHYGFRMWDILYFLSNWDLPSDEEFEQIIQSETPNEPLVWTMIHNVIKYPCQISGQYCIVKTVGENLITLRFLKVFLT